MTGSHIIINAGLLEEALKTLLPFVSKEEARLYLNGVHFHSESGSDTLHLVATDGHKLCVLDLDVTRGEDYLDAISCILPTAAIKTIQLMLKQVGNKEFPIGISFTPSELRLDAADQKGDFRLLDGEFPDYRRVIPTTTPNFTIGLLKEQAAEALKAVIAHTAKDPLEWQMTDADSPLLLSGPGKTVVVMPCRKLEEIN